jgi:flagellin-like protein
MDRRGISPLIATVLIIGFTIVLAVLVITWISGTVTEQTDSTDCMVEVENTCLSAIGKIEGTYNFTVGLLTVTNTGGDDFDLKMIGVDPITGTTAAVEDSSVAAYATGTDTYTAAAATLTTLRVIPIVDNGECIAECEVLEIVGFA